MMTNYHRFYLKSLVSVSSEEINKLVSHSLPWLAQRSSSRTSSGTRETERGSRSLLFLCLSVPLQEGDKNCDVTTVSISFLRNTSEWEINNWVCHKKKKKKRERFSSLASPSDFGSIEQKKQTNIWIDLIPGWTFHSLSPVLHLFSIDTTNETDVRCKGPSIPSSDNQSLIRRALIVNCCRCSLTLSKFAMWADRSTLKRLVSTVPRQWIPHPHRAQTTGRTSSSSV